MANTIPRIHYWTKWRTVIELIKFFLFLVLEVLIIYIILIELMVILKGGGLPLNLPSNIPTFKF